MINFYLPLTSQPRELDAKLFLALVAAERGHRAWIGYKTAYQSELYNLPQGIFLAHNARQKLKNIRVVSESGHYVLVLDEEALVRQTDEIFLKKHPPNAFRYVSKILCWGQDDYDMWKNYNLKGEFENEIVGNLRFDLLRPELSNFYQEEIATLKNRFGDFVLLNTNFPTINNSTSVGGGVRLNKQSIDDRGRMIAENFLTNKKFVFEQELALIKPLADAIYPKKLVIRPHPNENQKPWHDAVKNIENAHVIFEGGVVPWLWATKVLIHNNCTTAVEAAATGLPIINFIPRESEFDNPLSNAFGKTATSIDDVIKHTSEILSGQTHSHSEQQEKILRHHVASVTGQFSAERLVALSEKLMSSEQYKKQIDHKKIDFYVKEAHKLRRARRLKHFITLEGWRLRRHLLSTHPEIKINNLDHEQLNYSIEQIDLLARQFPPFQSDDINKKIRKFSEATGRFQNIKLTMQSQFMMKIESEKNEVNS